MKLDDTKEYYEDIIDLTSHPAWPKFKEEVLKEIYHLQAGTLDNIKTVEELYFAKGYAAALAATAHLRETAKALLEQTDAL
jgi:hypothetical protein